ncbi:MAG: Xaa-Pro peptidase family protein [Chloroflexota bacterium]
MSFDPVRQARNTAAMKEHDLDAVVCRLPENVLLLTGYWPLSGLATAFVPREGPARLIVAHTEAREVPPDAAGEIRAVSAGVLGAPDPYESIGRQLADIARAAGLEKGRIGHEGDSEAVAPGVGAAEIMVPSRKTRSMLAHAMPGSTLIDATIALDSARLRKTPIEVERLRRANEIACFGLRAFRETYEPGQTEAEVAAQVESAIMSRGTGYDSAGHVRAWAQLMSGPESARAYSAHPATSSRTIMRGDLGVLELATVVDGYWSDLTRTLVAGGRPDARQQELFGVVRAAHHAVLTGARPGMRGAAIDALARDVVDRHGLGHLFVHHTGHGLGFRYHETGPMLHPASQDVVDVDMVTSVEPGLYIEGYGGMRLEDNVVFTETGPELLSLFDSDLIGSSMSA